MTNNFNKPLTLLFVLLVAMNCYIGSGFTPSSDQSSGIIIARDIASGNLILKDWFLSTVTFYFTDLIWYSLFSLLGVSNHIQSFLVPSLILSGLTVVCTALVISKKKIPWAIFLSFGIVGIYSSQIYNLAVTHVGAYLYTAIIYLLIERSSSSENGKKYSIAIFILSLAIFFSDDISKYSFLIPLTLSLFLDLTLKRNLKTLPYLASIIIAFAISKILLLSVMHFGGFQLPGVGQPRFATQQEFINNLGYILNGSLRLFEGYIFGLQIDLFSFATAVRLCYMLFFFYFITFSIRNLMDYSIIDRSLLITALVMPFAFIFSNIPSAIDSIRYIAPSVIFGSVFICRHSRLSNKHSIAALVIAIISGFIIYTNAITTEKRNLEIEHLTKFIKEYGLKRGFASFWYASSVSLNSGAILSPVVFNNNEGSVKPFLWLTKTTNYEDDNTFVIADSDADKDVAISQFGHPDLISKVASKSVMIWRKGIAIPFNGFNIKTNDSYFGSTGLRKQNSTCPKEGGPFIVTGPYRPLKQGTYSVSIDKDGSGEVNGDVVALGGQVTIAEINNSTKFDIQIDKTYPDIEVRIYNAKNSSCIKSISVEKK
ncbi:TPA: hypothetical protein ACS28E_004457 [Enterobacter roggenkampii]